MRSLPIAVSSAGLDRFPVVFQGQDSVPVEMSLRPRRPYPVIGGTKRAKTPATLAGALRPFCGWGVRIADYTVNENLITKVLDFDQLGGPKCTVDGTVFEMWLGGL